MPKLASTTTFLSHEIVKQLLGHLEYFFLFLKKGNNINVEAEFPVLDSAFLSRSHCLQTPVLSRGAPSAPTPGHPIFVYTEAPTLAGLGGQWG